jgi:hypothetical protein
MHDLIPLSEAGAIVAYADEPEALLDFAANEKAPATRRAYRRDFRAFEVWCRSAGSARCPPSLGPSRGTSAPSPPPGWPSARSVAGIP